MTKTIEHYPKLENIPKGQLEWRKHKWNPEKEYPYCSLHGAMLRLSKRGIWRCYLCHIGWDEEQQISL